MILALGRLIESPAPAVNETTGPVLPPGLMAVILPPPPPPPPTDPISAHQPLRLFSGHSFINPKFTDNIVDARVSIVWPVNALINTLLVPAKPKSFTQSDRSNPVAG